MVAKDIPIFDIEKKKTDNGPYPGSGMNLVAYKDAWDRLYLRDNRKIMVPIEAREIIMLFFLWGWETINLEGKDDLTLEVVTAYTKFIRKLRSKDELLEIEYIEEAESGYRLRRPKFKFQLITEAIITVLSSYNFSSTTILRDKIWGYIREFGDEGLRKFIDYFATINSKWQLFILMHLSGKTGEEMSQIFGVSQSVISRISIVFANHIMSDMNHHEVTEVFQQSTIYDYSDVEAMELAARVIYSELGFVEP